MKGGQGEGGNNIVNIYSIFSGIGGNGSLRMVTVGELRLDIFVTEYALEALRGRYSYTEEGGWKKVIKEAQCEQLDFMSAERTFRLAVTREIQTEVTE